MTGIDIHSAASLARQRQSELLASGARQRLAREARRLAPAGTPPVTRAPAEDRPAPAPVMTAWLRVSAGGRVEEAAPHARP